MSVTPIANIHFINQNAPVASATQANQQARFDLANAMANELASDLNEEITEIRPTEETYKIDPQHQHEKNKSDQEQSLNEENQNEQEQEQISEDEITSKQKHILDIKI
ncbi:hypothetical protein LMG7974_01281 [Campylobacter majalis]|uniref:Flagellar hook-length control protein FliK n=1 Tax=Campylobacter majalis TaxID=2790656 RepID=A0ABN7KC55_9BACT|nr:hypothetical protein [Campylobacter majalis]CAD7288982.1 hypothetical protein LMG7974_01281 [Campylobacter majalis]